MTFLGLAIATTLHAGVVIPWDATRDHVGRRITVEGVVVQARRVGSATVLEFTADDPQAFTVKLFQPVFRREPRHPETHYRGRRIQASGVVKQFQGRTEMIIRNANQIVVLPDQPLQAEAPDEPVVAPSPALGDSASRVIHDPVSEDILSRGAAAPAPTEAAAGEDTTTHAARPTAAPPPTKPPAVEQLGAAERARCATARTEWRKLHPSMQRALGLMQDCLAQDRARCDREIDGLYAALADFDAAQARLDQACPTP